jgi:hypothetical protein
VECKPARRASEQKQVKRLRKREDEILRRLRSLRGPRDIGFPVSSGNAGNKKTKRNRWRRNAIARRTGSQKSREKKRHRQENKSSLSLSLSFSLLSPLSLSLFSLLSLSPFV